MSKEYSSYQRRSAVVNETFDDREVWHSIPGNGQNFFLLPAPSLLIRVIHVHVVQSTVTVPVLEGMSSF